MTKIIMTYDFKYFNEYEELEIHMENKSLLEIKDKILDIYEQSENSIADIMDRCYIAGLSLETTVMFYVEVRNLTEEHISVIDEEGDFVF